MAGSAVVGILRAVLAADAAEFETAFTQAGKAVSVWTQDLNKAGLSAKQVGEVMTNSLTRSLADVNKLTKEFSGAGVAKSADEYAAAIQRLGGATTLTGAEQAKVNAVMREALEKYKALGQEAPAHIAKLEQATRKLAAPTEDANSKVDKFVSGLKNAAGVMGVAFGAAAVVGGLKKLGEHVLDTAANINVMSQRTGVSTDAIQRYGFAARQAGSNMDTVSTAIGKMNVNISEGGKETVKALTDMKLKFADISAMSPEQQFNAITEAIRGIDDPAKQAELAVRMFGKAGQELLPTIKQGFIDLGKGADIMSKDTIEQLDKAKQAWENFGNSVTVITGNMIGTVMTAVDRMTSKWENFGQFLLDTAKYGSAAALQLQSEYAIAAESAAKASATLTKEQGNVIDGHRAFGWSVARIAETMGKTEEVIRHYLKYGLEPVAEGEKKLTDAQIAAANERAEALKNLTSGLKDLTARQQAQISSLLIAGKSESDIAKAYGYTAQQVKEVKDVEAKRIAQNTAAMAEFERRTTAEKALADQLEHTRDRSGQVMDVVKLMPSAMGDWTAAANVNAAALKAQDVIFQALLRANANALREGKQINAEAEKAAKAHADAVAGYIGVIGSAFNSIASQGGAAFREIAKYTDIAIAGIQNYVKATAIADKAARASAQSTAISTAGMTMGLSFLTQGITTMMADKAKWEAGQKTIRDLKAELTALGVTVRNLPPIDLVTGDGIDMISRLAHRTTDEIESLTTQLERAQAATEALATARAEGPANAMTGIASALGVTHAAYESLGEAQEHLTALQTQYADAEIEDQAAIQREIQKTIAAIELQKKIIEITGIASESAGQAVAAGLVGIINANVKAGSSFVDAIRASQPAIEALKDQLMATGYDGGAAFNFINDELLLITDEIAGPALQAVEGFGAGIRGLADAGILTEEMFAGLTEQIGSTYDKLIAQGADGQAVLLAMQAPLQAAWEAEEKFGFKTDDATQALIDQAVEAGLVGKEHKSATQQMIDALDRMGDTLERIADKLTGKGGLAEAGETTASRIQGAFDRIKAPTLRLPVIVDDAEFDGGGASGDGFPGFSQPERKMTAGGIASKTVGGLAGMSTVGSSGRGSINLTVVSKLDGRAVAKNQIRYIPGELKGAGL